jgi:hypothetical protein
MKKPTKKAREMTTEELAKRLFPKPLLKKLKDIANPVKRKVSRQSS